MQVEKNLTPLKDDYLYATQEVKKRRGKHTAQKDEERKMG